MTRLRRGLLIQTLLISGFSLVMAADGRTPIPFSSPGTPPIVIDQPGSYILTRSLSGAGPVIHVTVPNVEIDLNGMTLAPSAGGSGILVNSAARATIRNGFITGGSRGIDSLGEVVVEDVAISGSSNYGMSLFGSGPFAIRRCTIQDTGDSGIVVDGPAGGACQGTIESSVVERALDGIRSFDCTVKIDRNQVREIMAGGFSTAAVIVLGGAASIITNNTIQDVDNVEGLVVQNSAGVLVSQNTVSNVINDEGISIAGGTEGCKIYNNVVANVDKTGIVVSGIDHLLLNNVVRNAGRTDLDGHAVRVLGDRNHIEGNLMNGSDGYGLIFESSAGNNVYRRNTARGNTGSSGGAPCELVLDFCNLGSGNSSQGDNWMPNQQ